MSPKYRIVRELQLLQPDHQFLVLHLINGFLQLVNYCTDSFPFFPVRIRIASSTWDTDIFPSPTLPV